MKDNRFSGLDLHMIRSERAGLTPRAFHQFRCIINVPATSVVSDLCCTIVVIPFVSFSSAHKTYDEIALCHSPTLLGYEL